MEGKTIVDLYHELNKGKTTSEALVTYYLKEIEAHEGRVNALADLNHLALLEAKALDQERITHGPRSMLHGIPILVKDNILTHDHLRTTANALVFKDFYAPFEGQMISQLRKAGAIILAKSNCSEFAYFMSFGNMPSGYGSMHKQVKHPYNEKIDPLGSSTGSAVGIAMDFATAAVGTETSGSLISPAQANSIVTIKPSLGLVSRDGIIPISLLQDTAGPMSKSVIDSAIMLDTMKGQDKADIATLRYQSEGSFYEACKKPVKGMKIGILNFTNYKNDDEENTILEEAKKVLEKAGASLQTIDFEYKMPPSLDTLKYEFKRDFNHFLSTIKGLTPIDTLQDLIKFNLESPSLRLKYAQRIFTLSEGVNQTLKDARYLKAKRIQTEELERFNALFTDNQIDAIIATKITGYPAALGSPVISVPAKALNDTRPINLLFMGKIFDEATIFPIAYTYEQATKKRIPPKKVSD
ncbi:MAG: amidase family protein [Candidatus Izemoplasmataceae bacterium]